MCIYVCICVSVCVCEYVRVLCGGWRSCVLLPSARDTLVQQTLILAHPNTGCADRSDTRTMADGDTMSDDDMAEMGMVPARPTTVVSQPRAGHAMDGDITGSAMIDTVHGMFANARACVCVYVSVCACVCVCECERVCMCVCRWGHYGECPD